MFNKAEQEFLNRLSGKEHIKINSSENVNENVKENIKENIKENSKITSVVKEFKYLGLSLGIGFITTFIIALIMTMNSIETFAEVTSQDLQESVLRLHIRANSNSDEDQALKIKVRDAILEEFKPELTSAETKEELVETIEANYDRVIETAEKVVKENGYDYEVRANVGETYLETKQYGDVYLPAGTYDALVIEIGSGEGNNWWCVLFPPLCYVGTDETIPEKDREILQESLTDEEYELITNQEDMDIQFKFKLLEMYGKQDK